MPSLIRFHSEDTKFKVKSAPSLKKWILRISEEEKYSLREINYIFCSDPYLLNINQSYLNHNYLTDIITFDNSDESGIIEGDIFISVDRVKENAEKFNVDFYSELRRVIAHGLLHLIGYKDKSPTQKTEMRKKEDFYLNLFV